MVYQLITALALMLAPANASASTDSIDNQTEKVTWQLPTPPAKPSGTAIIVISKLDLTLRVYDRNEKGDTVLVAQYPCCMGKNKGDKKKRGDMRTPESPAGKPFKISMIQDASTWRHDFHDGRGNIKAYGHWFLRLVTPGHSGIGIHGSTNNEKSVPGRASEGCIRLLDQDIITLKKHFAYVGMPVFILGETQQPLEWEIRARDRVKQ
ncbi:MAG: L,D-transpeptidase [Muribaculaceae bacterium]|nr:L,D-transpeptidase [Muribaculaceae bacterium]